MKKAILHRKNAIFHKMPNGAHVGDLFMSLIDTCELEGVNPFQYLTALQRHADAQAANSTAWLPCTIETRWPRRRRCHRQATADRTLRRLTTITKRAAV